MKKIKTIEFRYDPLPAKIAIIYYDGSEYELGIYRNQLPDGFLSESNAIAFYMAALFQELTERVKTLEDKVMGVKDVD